MASGLNSLMETQLGKAPLSSGVIYREICGALGVEEPLNEEVNMVKFAF